MRELYLVRTSSTPPALVLRTRPASPASDAGAPTDSDAPTADAATGEEFLLPLEDEETRAAIDRLLGSDAASDAGSGPDADAPEKKETPGARKTSEDKEKAEGTPGGHDAEATQPEPPASGATRIAPPGAGASRPQSGGSRPAEGRRVGEAGGRASQEPDPRLSAPLTMRPREIQDRIRGGASVEELADAMGVTPSRVEGFAHPVLQERARVAELARHAHPVRADGPAPLTLSEMLAAACAARGLSFEDSIWDSYRDSAHQWVITIRWNTSPEAAEWTLADHMTSAATATPRNEYAADLTDRRQRHTDHPERAGAARWLSPVEDTSLDAHNPAPSQATVSPLFDQENPQKHTTTHEPEENTTTNTTHPPTPKSEENTDNKPKRRRKTTTPHWEDVLLGVRTNTKRPRP